MDMIYTEKVTDNAEARQLPSRNPVYAVMLDLRDLPCQAVIGYLSKHGWEWTQLEPYAADHVIWASRDDDRRVVFVPINSARGDYGHRMSRVLAALESWEGRDQDAILADIRALHEASEEARFSSEQSPPVV